jgi:hypothetical protein
MKKNKFNETSIHLAARKENKEIIILLLNIFNEEEKEKLIESLIQQTIGIFAQHLINTGTRKKNNLMIHKKSKTNF